MLRLDSSDSGKFTQMIRAYNYVIWVTALLEYFDIRFYMPNFVHVLEQNMLSRFISNNFENR